MASNAMQPASTTSSCPLLKLPPEVRLQIYEELFTIYKGRLCLATAHDGNWYKVDSIRGYKPKTRGPGRSVALLATCKQIYTEAKPVLYGNIAVTLYYCDTCPPHLDNRPVTLLNIITDVHAINLDLDFMAVENLTSEEVHAVLEPFVQATNNASSSRWLNINLEISRPREQERLDWVMLCLGEIESNAEITMSLTMVGNSDHSLDSASFETLLKKFLRVDETWKVWQAQLDWERDRHKRQNRRLAKFDGKFRRRQDQYELLCAAAGLCPVRHYRHSPNSYDVLLCQDDLERLTADKDWCREWIQEAEEKIADLERKLGQCHGSG